MTDSSKLFAALVSWVALVLSGSSPRAEPVSPALLLPIDVLVVVVDDVGWSTWNAAELPVLKGLQAEGVTFAQAYSMPACTATRFTLQFGRYGRRNASGWIGAPIQKPDALDADLGQVSLPLIAQRMGLATAHFGKWHLSSTQNYVHELAPNLHGYANALAWSHGNLGIQTPAGSGSPGDYFHWLRTDDGVESVDTTYATTAVADAFIAWWREHAHRPRFAHVSFNAPHPPHHDPPAALLPAGTAVGPEPWQKSIAMLMAVDAEVGRMLAAVDLARTVVFVLSDNGNTSGAALPGRDEDELKFTVHEGGVNVPLVVRTPWSAGPFVSQRLVSFVDLQATLADLLGYGGPVGEDSLSFADELGASASTSARTHVFAEWFTPNGDPHAFERHARMIRDAEYKLIIEEEPPGVEQLRQLYRLEGGFPLVEVPVSDPAVEAELEALLRGV